jgi:hypothetical protein
MRVMKSGHFARSRRVDKLEMGENEKIGFDGERAARIYGGKIWSVVTEFIPPSFRRPEPARIISHGGSIGIVNFCMKCT